MTTIPDWSVWLVAAALAALFIWYYWHVGRSLWRGLFGTVRAIQEWPAMRRALVEAEARAGGRHPWWYRAARVLVVLATLGLAGYMTFRLLTGGG